MPQDRDFSRRAGLQAFFVAFFSLAYAAVYLGAVRDHPDAHGMAALAWALLTAGALSSTIAVVGLAGRVRGALDRRYLALLGVGWALLSAAHGAYAGIAELAGRTPPDLSPTDPRGFATFGLAGLWAITVGVIVSGGASDLPRRLGWFAIVDGVDLILLFVATIAGSAPLITVTGGLASVILGPAFWIWTGRVLRR